MPPDFPLLLFPASDDLPFPPDFPLLLFPASDDDLPFPPDFPVLLFPVFDDDLPFPALDDLPFPPLSPFPTGGDLASSPFPLCVLLEGPFVLAFILCPLFEDGETLEPLVGEIVADFPFPLDLEFTIMDPFDILPDLDSPFPLDFEFTIMDPLDMPDLEFPFPLDLEFTIDPLDMADLEFPFPFDFEFTMDPLDMPDLEFPFPLDFEFIIDPLDMPDLDVGAGGLVGGSCLSLVIADPEGKAEEAPTEGVSETDGLLEVDG